jgi:type IV fimbrial biogenesis protein FimT
MVHMSHRVARIHHSARAADARIMRAMNTPACVPAARDPGRAARARGYSLVEMVVVLSVAATLMAAGVPSVASMLASVKLSSVSNNLLFNLYLARSEAIKRNAQVVLCKSADGATCASSGGWEQGAIVFHDVNNNGARDPGESVIHREQPSPREIRVSGNQSVGQYVSYGPDGRSRLASGAFQAGTLTLCRQSTGSTDARQIVINSGGRPRVQKTLVSFCG